MNVPSQPVSLITGAGSLDGIGFATARRLAERGPVVLASTTRRIVERARELTDLGGNAIGVVGDLTKQHHVNELVATALQAFGRVDVCVNNAGMTSIGALDNASSTETLSLNAWHESLDRNITTAFLVTRGVLGGMRLRGFGRIINVASTTGPVSAMPGDPAYAASKAAMVGFTRAVALEAADARVTVNAVAPGWIATGSQLPQEALAGKVTPMLRSGTADEVAAVIAFLASPDASYVTGQCWVIDGGNSIMEDRRAL
jgi:3-oxoacyl-[acyl-carrier protein] reductase